MTNSKKFTNKEITDFLLSKGLKVRKDTAWANFIEGEINGKKVAIGCGHHLTSLVVNGQILPEYFSK